MAMEKQAYGVRDLPCKLAQSFESQCSCGLDKLVWLPIGLCSCSCRFNTCKQHWSHHGAFAGVILSAVLKDQSNAALQVNDTCYLALKAL